MPLFTDSGLNRHISSMVVISAVPVKKEKLAEDAEKAATNYEPTQEAPEILEHIVIAKMQQASRTPSASRIEY